MSRRGSAPAAAPTMEAAATTAEPATAATTKPTTAAAIPATRAAAAEVGALDLAAADARAFILIEAAHLVGTRPALWTFPALRAALVDISVPAGIAVVRGRSGSRLGSRSLFARRLFAAGRSIALARTIA